MLAIGALTASSFSVQQLESFRPIRIEILDYRERPNQHQLQQCDDWRQALIVILTTSLTACLDSYLAVSRLSVVAFVMPVASQSFQQIHALHRRRRSSFSVLWLKPDWPLVSAKSVGNWKVFSV
jgi:hypothetical protein